MKAKDYALQVIKRCNTNNPFAIASMLDVLIIRCHLVGLNGFYQYHKRNHIVYLSDSLDELLSRFVLAHELGHMQMHWRMNTVFMDTKTLDPHSRYERQANTFAVELLMPDELLNEYEGYSIYQMARVVGVPDEMAGLKAIGRGKS